MAYLENLYLQIHLRLAAEKRFQDMGCGVENSLGSTYHHAVVAGLSDHKADVKDGAHQVYDVVNILRCGGVIDVKRSRHHALILSTQGLRVIDEEHLI